MIVRNVCLSSVALINSMTRSNMEECGGLNENDPQRLIDLNTWSPGSAVTI